MRSAGASLLLLMLLLAFVGTMRAQSLTVHDGSTTNGNVPVYGFYADAYNKCEMVYPAAELSEMAGGMINGMTFYATQSSVSWGSAQFQVFVAEVADATISAFAGPGTVVYEGQLSIVDGEMVVTFDTPYTYSGGNLLVGFYQTSTGNYITSTWYGEGVNGASGSGYNYSSLDGCTFTQRNFLPKTTFDYTVGGGELVEVTIGDPTSTTTNAYLPGYSLYDYAISQQIYTADEIGTNGTINTLTMWLKNSSSYARNLNVYMAEIEASEFTSNSDWVSMTADNMVASFTMQNGITEPVEMALDLSNPFNYSGSGNLVICIQDATGQWSSGLGGVEMDAAGNQAIYAYRDGTVFDPSNPGVNGTLLAKKNVIKLDITVGGGEPFEVQVGDGTNESGYYPFYTLYNYSIAEGLYRASELYEAGMSAGTINSLSWYALNETGNEQQGITIWMANVTDDELTTTSHVVTDMTKVFTGTSTPVIGWNEFAFNESDFEWDGASNILVFCQRNNGTWNSTIKWAATEVGSNVMSYKYQDSDAYDVTVPNTMSVAQSRSNTIFKGVTNGGGLTGPEIVANPDFIEMGYRPIGYWMEPVTFELYNQGTAGTITSVNSEEPFFAYDVEVPFVIGAGESLFGKVGTSTTAEAGDIDDQLEVTYVGPGLSGEATAYVNVAATAYDAVSPDVWELAQEVTEFPFQTTTTTADLYKNYNLLGMNDMAKDAVYKVNFEEDVLFSAGTNGANPVAKMYPEGFNGVGGPSYNNYYEYNGPEVNPGPVNWWFAYDYTGSNTWYGTSAGSGMVFGYKITPGWLQQLGLGNAAIVTVESAARNATNYGYYDLILLKGGDEPDFNNMVYYQGFDGFTPGYYFDINLDEPQFLGDDENIWVMFETDAPYAAYCGRNPIDAENGKIWYSLDYSTWNSNTNYTPVIYTRFIDLPTGREVTVNLADMKIRESKPAAGELAEANGDVMGISKAQMQKANRGNRDTQTLFEQGFEDGMGEWTMNNCHSSSGPSSSYTAHGGSSVFRFYYTTNYPQYLISPVLEDNNGGNMSFYYASYSSNYAETFKVGYSTTTNDPSAFTWGSEVTATNLYSSEYLQYSYDFPAGTKYVAIACTSNDQFYLFIDDILVTAEGGDTPTPPTPTATYQIEDMYVPAGTYYVVVASTDEDFQVDMHIAEVPAPEQAVVISPFDTETNVDYPYLAEWQLGNFTKEMQVLYGTEYPPTTPLIDWTDYLVESAFLPELAHNRMYFFQVNERNEMGTTEGEITSFTTPFDTPQYFQATTPYIYIGDVAEFSWGSIEDEQFVGYYLYDQNYNPLNDGELLTETTFQIENLDYNPYGYYFYLEAVYELGSAPLMNTRVYVSGYGNIEGTVYEQDGETPIDGVTVYFDGYDEFGIWHVFNAVTDENGEYSAILLAGSYETLWASREGYQDKFYPESLYLSYQDTISNINFIMDETFAPVDNVVVNYNPDEDDPSSPYVKVEWTNNERSFNRYRVYRTAYDNYGPYSVHNTELLAEITSETSYIDETWENMESGLYKYGVSRVYEGNRDNVPTEFTENFDNGLPSDWTIIDADYDGRCWMTGSAAALGNGHGHNGSNDMMISKSFEYGSEICPDNYLVTPLVKFTAFSEFSFWACAQDANYADEYFEVRVSTGSNDNQYDFWYVNGWTLADMDNYRGPRNSRAQGNWYEFKVDLGAYAGQQGYVAIRHCYNCGNFYLDIDDVTLFDANAQVERESEIVWSNNIGKDMFLTNGDVNISVMLNSGDSPAGATAILSNMTEPEYGADTIVFDETGYYAWETFRRGDYEVLISKEGYDGYWDYVSIWEPTSLQYMIDEVMTAPTNLHVSASGYATWDPEENRHFEGAYIIWVYDEYGSFIFGDNVNEEEVQIPEDYLNDQVTYVVYVYKEYSSGWWSDPAETSFKYVSCNHLPGVRNLYAQMVDDNVYMSWNYPVIESNEQRSADAWDLLHSFDATSGYQYGVASDGEFIYTSSWTTNSSSMFYKYDMNGNFIEEFNIDECGLIRDMTYDGQYFYGVALSNTIYCLDLANHNLVYSFTTSYGDMRCCAYDSDRDGFWVVGNWGGDLCLIDRSGNIQISGPTPSSASGVAYYKDLNDVGHVLISNNSEGKVYDFDIASFSINEEPVCDLTTALPGFSGSTGGCHVGKYNGKVAFFADVQQSPQLIGIFELYTPEMPALVGANIYHNGELVEFLEYDPEVQSYTFEGEDYGQWDSYSLQVLYEDNRHACTQDAYMLSEYTVYVDDSNIWALHVMPNSGQQWHRSEGGSVVGTGDYLELDTCTLVAVPDEGYAFYYWYNFNTNEYFYDTDTITFVVNGAHNNFEANFKIYEQHSEFTSGWNWWASYIEQNTINGFEQLTNQLTETGNMINSQTAFTQNYGEYGWYGSLSSLTNESMYKVKMNEAYTAAILGQLADPADHPITLTEGWNWIGYPLTYATDLNEAFANVNAASGDMVKSQYAYANYYDGYGWFGSLNTIEPGVGLMYKSVNDDPVTFTYGAEAKVDLRDNLKGNHWTVNHHDYSNNMTMMAVVDMEGEELKSDQYELAAFVNGVCRGSIVLSYVDPIDRYVAFMTISGEGDEELTFGLYDAILGKEYFDSETMVTFVPDAMVGSFENPFVVNFRNTTGLDELNASMRLYPNPVASGETIHINLAEKPVRVEILNTLGETMVVETKLQEPFGITAPSTPGVYTVRVITENKGIISHKVIVK